MQQPSITEFKKAHSLNRTLDILKHSGEKAYIHNGTYADVLIWGYKRMVFIKAKNYNLSNGVLFRMVTANVKKYLQAHPKVKAAPALPTNKWDIDKSISRRRRPITGTDISYAYWNIAFQEGYITETTFFKGLNHPDKGLKLAALANLSSVKKFKVIEDGRTSDEYVTLNPHDNRMTTIYSNIRYRCYQIMMAMADMLGKDFIGYNVDCIYYVDSKKNRQMIYEFLDDVGFEYAQIKVKKPQKK